MKPLASLIEATGAEIAIHQAILKCLRQGSPSGLDVVEPYPLFFRELVHQSTARSAGPDSRHSEPASSWSELLEFQKEAMHWLARCVRLL